MVPDAAPRSYYGRPVLKSPPWKANVPLYFFTGGLAGASSVLAVGARRVGNAPLARAALLASAAGLLPSPALLIDDLGRPERFANMLRVLRPTSPLSVGSWVLAGFGPASVGAAVCEVLGVLPRAQRTAERVAGALGPVVATYTAVLLADTAVPAWHDARRELPLVFAGSAAASAGAAACVLAPVTAARPARALALGGAFVARGALEVMGRRDGAARSYASGGAGRARAWSHALTAAGATLLAGPGRRRRAAAVGGGALMLAGALCERFAVVRAGMQSARATEPPKPAG
jgi:formate-dependent nitrite reductase membrane component NrfD